MSDGAPQQASSDPAARLARLVAERSGGRSALAAEFARTALRRVPTVQLANADGSVIADWLADAFRWFDEEVDRTQQRLRIRQPDVAFDGRSDAGTVVEVAGEDRPFLLSTIRRTIEDVGPGIVRSLHPIFGTERDDDGRLTVLGSARGAAHRESFVHVELDTALDGPTSRTLRERLTAGVNDVMRATSDHRAMCRRVAETAEELRALPADRAPHDEATEAAALLDWLLADNFVLLGWREYRLEHTDGGETTIVAVPDSGLGILRDVSDSRYAEPQALSSVPADQRERLLRGPLLRVSRSNRRSTVHTLRRMDYIGVLLRDDEGRVVAERLLLGLFTGGAMTEPARTTPVLRRKLSAILEREDVVPGSHEETVLVSLFQSLPKDELFQTELDDLHQTLVVLLEAEEHGRTRVLVRVDEFTRTVSVLLAVPRDDYSPAVRQRVTQLLLQRFGTATVDVDLTLGDRLDAVVRFTVHVEGELPRMSVTGLERDLVALVRPWRDILQQRLIEDFGEADGTRLMRTLASRLPVSYREITPPEVARDDLVRLDLLLGGRQPLAVWLQALDDGLHVKAAVHGRGLELSDFLPILESLGLRVLAEVPHHLEGLSPTVALHDFRVRDERGDDSELPDFGPTAEAILAAAAGRCEVDSLNRLVVRAGLGWDQVAVVRAYRRYRRQVGTAFTTEYVNEALTDNTRAAARLVDYFETRFDPEHDGDDTAVDQARELALAACDEIQRLDHDRIVRGMVSLVDATLRTNAFQTDRDATDAFGQPAPYLAFKFDSARVPDVPHPVPHREIFVYSPALEGIHLRGGPVARGGLRWSDRRDDVRTEVLGLMKAQVVKNAMIVPTGAKGGFVLKRPPPTSEALREDVERQYVTFIRALLSLTDNVVQGEVVPPERVRRRDGDDPYLVVAADRGTATFSDVANRIASETGFWLGDAFASGGSSGYDHKRLGITARGAWVAVRRHFRELGVDVESDPVTVAGIGDMSGDVFGNAMLLSRTIRLVAAFDHRHIFLDPDPDPEAAFVERERLFGLARSSWGDYDPDVISTGGGVWSRDDKRIALTDEVRERLRIDDEVLSPPELVQAILRAPVDLLYAGGIGTFVKASTETHADVGDRSNDELRVDATDLRARVIGEGANLAITQRGRIQYARRGGRVDQDAVHNAAGVAISDREVNLKILLAIAEEQWGLTRDDRDRKLAAVTDEVVEQVLADVDRQTWQLSQQAGRSAATLDDYRATIDDLEELGFLSRAVDVLPTDEELLERAEAGAGLTRPELATILAASKRATAQDVVQCELPEDRAVAAAAATYFPARTRDEFAPLIPQHRLRRELVASILANSVVDGLGPAFVGRLAAETGRSRTDAVAAYWAAHEVGDGDRWWDAVDDLTGTLAPERQLEIKATIDRLVANLSRAYLDDPVLPAVAPIVDRDRETFEMLREELMRLGTSRQRQSRLAAAQRLLDDLVAPDLADVAAGAVVLGLTPDVAALARRLDAGSDQGVVVDVADAMLRISDELGIDRLGAVLDRIRPDGRWQARQRTGLTGDLRRLRREAVTTAIGVAGSLATAVDTFAATAQPRLDHVRATIGEVEGAHEPTLDAVAVATRAVSDTIEVVGR